MSFNIETLSKELKRNKNVLIPTKLEPVDDNDYVSISLMQDIQLFRNDLSQTVISIPCTVGPFTTELSVSDVHELINKASKG